MVFTNAQPEIINNESCRGKYTGDADAYSRNTLNDEVTVDGVHPTVASGE